MLNRSFSLAGLVADVVLFAAALLWLLDYSPLDQMPAARERRDAIETLRREGNLILDLPGTTIKPGSQNMRIAKRPKEVDTLVKFIKAESAPVTPIEWSKVISVGFSAVSVPVGPHTLEAIHPLYVGLPPLAAAKQDIDLISVGQLEDLDRWISRHHQRNVVIFIASLLLVGFLLQILARFERHASV
jgi:hypothetical protein